LEARRTPSVSFAAQQTFAAGISPFAVAIGDFNGDGRPDLATADFNGNTASVLLNTAVPQSTTPSFSARQSFAGGGEPWAVAVADFNGDGRPDLAIANLADKTVSVLLNTTPAGAGTASFAAQQTFAVGTQPLALAVADFNGDGRPDLVAVNYVDDTVSVLLNQTPAGSGTASFAAQKTLAVGSNPQAVAVGDFNGDARPDIVVANSFGTVSVLLNTTTPGASTASFATQQIFSVGSHSSSVAVAEFNGDGRADLALANNSDNTVSVLLNTTAAGSSTASFAPQKTFAVGSGPISVAAGDFDGDGRPDLAVANESDKSVSVLLNTTPPGAGTPAFSSQQTFALGSVLHAVTAGDISGDGRPDLVAVSATPYTAFVLLNASAPFANTVPVVVGEFGNTGVWEFNRAFANWVQLTPANASVLATDPQGDVAADFPGYGVQLYRPALGAWSPINGVDATQLAMDAHGDIVAEFPGYGVGEYRPASGWQTLTPANASLLAMDALGDVAAVFPGYGVQLFRPSVGWKQINAQDATLLAMDALGDVVANFHGVGVDKYLPATGWQVINGAEATALAADALGDVVANFAGIGVGQYLPTFGWRLFLPSNAALLSMDALGDVYGEFTGFGVWEAGPYRFDTQLRAKDASLLAVE
jgi:hypothetical protein